MTEEELEVAIASDPDSDPDVLEYFKARGPGYQTRINSVLRAYVEQVLAAKAKERAWWRALMFAPDAISYGSSHGEESLAP